MHLYASVKEFRKFIRIIALFAGFLYLIRHIADPLSSHHIRSSLDGMNRDQQIIDIFLSSVFLNSFDRRLQRPCKRAEGVIIYLL